jgi:hypothetical protein
MRVILEQFRAIRRPPSDSRVVVVFQRLQSLGLFFFVDFDAVSV